MTAEDRVQRIQTMATEMSRLGSCECHFAPASMLRVVGLIQLAKRHPQLDESSRHFVAAFVEHARRFFADCPTILNVIAEGDEGEQET